ncbi:MAG: putative Zn-dependent protease [Gammaproteobacteria bacterium]
MTVFSKTIRCLVILLSVITLPACQIMSKLNPDDSANEIKYGNQRASEVLAVTPLVQNESLQKYINHVGQWVAQQSSRPNLPWRFGLIQTDSIVSFSLPGGTVLISTGYFSLMENEAQLAAVLAHDIAHIDSRHYFKALRNRDWENLIRHGLDPSRDLDADRDAAVFIARAGYDPYAMLDLLTTLSAIDSEATEVDYLNATHPSAEGRLSVLAAEMDGRLDSFSDGKLNSERFLSFVQ